MVQDRTTNRMTNRKSHTRFRLVPKSTTFDDLEGPLCTVFQNACVFGTHHANLNEDRPIQSATKLYLMDSSCWQYNDYADTRGFLETGVKRQWGGWKRQFSVFSLAISSELLEITPKLLYGNI